MKFFTQYIKEAGLFSSEKNWFDYVQKTNNTLIRNNKVTTFKIDNTENIKGNEKPTVLKEMTNEERQLIKNNKIGFPNTGQLLSNESKVFFNDVIKNESQLFVSRYFYQTSEQPQQAYYIGISICSVDSPKVEGYINIYNLELSPTVNTSNKADIEKFILNNLKDTFYKLYSDRKGFVYDATNNKYFIKTFVNDLKFTKSQDNSNIYTIDFNNIRA